MEELKMTAKSISEYVKRALFEGLEKQKRYRIRLVDLYLKMINRGENYDAADISGMLPELDMKIHRIESVATAWPRAVEAISSEIVRRFKNKSTLYDIDLLPTEDPMSFDIVIQTGLMDLSEITIRLDSYNSLDDVFKINIIKNNVNVTLMTINIDSHQCELKDINSVPDVVDVIEKFADKTAIKRKLSRAFKNPTPIGEEI